MSLTYMDDFAGGGTVDSDNTYLSLGWNGAASGDHLTFDVKEVGGGPKNCLQLHSTYLGSPAYLQYTAQPGGAFNGAVFGFLITSDSRHFLELPVITSPSDLASSVQSAKVRLDGSGVISIMDWQGSVVATSPTGSVPWGADFYLEVKVELIDTGGVPAQDITVHCAAATLAASGAAVAGAGAAPWYLFGIVMQTDAALSWLTDFYWVILDGRPGWTDFLGPVTVTSFFPGAPSYTSWTPHGDPLNWRNVAGQSQEYSTNYNETSVFAGYDLFPFGISPFGWVPVACEAVGVRTLAIIAADGPDQPAVSGAMQTDAGGFQVLTQITWLPSTRTTPVYNDDVEVLVPGTAAGWTLADLTGLLFGYNTVTGNTGPMQVSQSILLVLGPAQIPTPASVAPAPVLPQSLGVYRGIVGINFYGMAFFGDAFAGVVGRASFDAFTEYGNTMQGLISSPPIHMNRKRVFISGFEIDVEAGVGLRAGQGSDPVWWLQWSKDGGRTWSTLAPPRSMGRIGEYRRRLRWLRMGEARQWVLRLVATDPVRRVVIGTFLDAREGMD